MDSKTIGHKNTLMLIEQVSGISNFANKINKYQSQTSQLQVRHQLNQLGNKVACEIEIVFDKLHGWLDIIHPESSNRYDFIKYPIKNLYIHNQILERIVKN
ncbi:TPA: hypothetical protein PVK16_002563 [Acinetobacter baumannii]|nr:hypothetical protein [Acinetobacter baumannii]HDK8955726.1 hypothetical protein [Acinetobacter baumannii]HDR2202779.1 hypothetical protein [Acinetobacter baumannii]